MNIRIGNYMTRWNPINNRWQRYDNEEGYWFNSFLFQGDGIDKVLEGEEEVFYCDTWAERDIENE